MKGKSLNIFVDASGVIYEVLQPVKTDDKILETDEPYEKVKRYLLE